MPATANSAQEMTNSPAVQKAVLQIENDAEKALATMKSNLSSATLKELSSGFTSAYKADAGRMDKAQGNFNREWNLVVFGKSKTTKKLIPAYEKFVISLCLLEEQNNQFTALADSQVAKISIGLIGLITEMRKGIAKRFVAVEAELKQLKKDLEKAQKEVTEAKWQAGINVALTAVTLALGPAGLGARIALGVGSFAAHTLVDAALGPSKGSVVGTVNTAAGEVASATSKLKPAAQKLAGAASGLVTLGLDIGEIQDAKQILADLQKRMPKVAKEYAMLAEQMKSHASHMRKLAAAYDSAVSGVQKATDKYKSSRKEYEWLLKEFKKVK